MKKIDSFRGANFWLSNFFLAPVTYEGLLYPSTEHAYQAAKTLDPQERYKFLGITCRQAKAIGYKVKMRPDWDSVKIDIMYEIVKQKFSIHDELQRKLLDTEDAELIEGNDWKDDFWGVCTDKGQNHLGKILMKIRDELKAI